MKKINILFLLVSLFILGACSDEHEPRVETLAAPQLENLPQSNYVLDKNQSENQFAKFTWTSAKYDLSVSLRNVLEMDKAGNDFASAATIASSTGTEVTVLIKEINNAMIRMELTPEEAANMEFRLISYLGAGNNYGEVSNVISATITPFMPGEIEYPMLYTPGNHQGWAPAESAPIYSVDNDGIYTGYLYLDGEFKFTSEPSWDGTNYGDGGSGALSTDGGAGNITAAAGYYYVTVNTSALTYKLEKREWGVIGDATPGGWDNDTDMIYDATDKLLKVDMTLTSGSIKFRVNDGWDIDLGLAEGGTIEDALALGGADIPVTAGDYRVILDLTRPEYKMQLTAQGDPLPEPEPEPEPTDYPDNIYMIGNFADWSWDSDKIVEFIPVASKDGHFWSIQYLTTDMEFKWAPGKAWSGDFGKLDETTGYEIVDGNAKVAEDGLYMIYIDLENSKIAIEAAKIYGMGDCFGSWDADTYPFTVDGAKASITTTGSGELRIYAGSSIAVSDWWTREFVILEGKIAYRGNGGDQERVSVDTGQTVTLDFSDGTGTIE